MRLKKIKFLILLAVLAFAGLAVEVNAQNYWNVIDNNRFRRMSQFERVQYEKAMQLLRDRQYRGAATEFDRFRIQYKESEVLPYIVFLCGYSLHCAKDRFKAIGLYNEVIDFYPGETAAAAPAMYYRGMAQFENGDISKGMMTMRELLDDPEYSKHPVAASASLQLVWNYWRNKEPLKAETYLKRIFELHRGSQAGTDARNYFIASCASTGRLKTSYALWYMEANRDYAREKKLSSAQLRIQMVNEIYSVIMTHHLYQHYFVRDELMSRYRGGKKGVDPIRQLWLLLKDYMNYYQTAGQMWDYYHKAINLLARHRFVRSSEFDKLVSEAVEFVIKTPDPKDKNGKIIAQQQPRLATLVGILLGTGRYEHAGYVNTRIKDDKVRSWNEYLVLSGQNKWEDAIRHVDQIAGRFASDAAMVSKCGWAKADILHHRLHKYDEAIVIYRSIGEPPGTLWQIAECYRKKGDIASAATTYNEIENAFPKSGAEAAWRRGNLYKNSGDKKRAVAEFRRIMKVYAKTGQASWSHQALESMGVDATGLGNVDEDF